MTALGHRVMQGIARSLDLPTDYFASRYTADPLILFRIFQYPSRPIPEGLDVRHGVGEHTDYGLLTLLRQDSRRWPASAHQAGAGSRRRRWRESFVCNIGDMLDRMTGGWYKKHAASRPPQHQRPRSPLVPALLRPRLRRPHRADPQCRDRRPRHALGRCERARVRRHLRRLHPRQGRQGLPGLAARAAARAAVSGRPGSTSR